VSASVGPRSRDAISGRTRGPRPTPPSRMNGCLGFALARSTFLLPRRLRSNQRPDSTARTAASLSRRSAHEDEMSVCRVHRPARHSTCPQSSLRASALLAESGARAAPHDSVSGAARTPVKSPRRGDRFDRAPSDPRGPALTRPSRSPPTIASSTPSSSSDDHQGWVAPGIFSADPGLSTGCLSPPT